MNGKMNGNNRHFEVGSNRWKKQHMYQSLLFRQGLITANGRKKDGFVSHALRHTFSTNMRKAGVPEMKITGHSMGRCLTVITVLMLKLYLRQWGRWGGI